MNTNCESRGTNHEFRGRARFPLFASRYSSGFTLVEALVSLALLATALVPAFLLATDALSLSGRIRHSLIASNLAQEGVEVVRAMRDANWFAGQPFDTGLTVCEAGCRVEWNSLSPVADASTPPLKRDNDSGLYQYLSGADSPFSRTITISRLNDVELVVKSLVAWNERTIPKSIMVEYHLFDWTK